MKYAIHGETGEMMAEEGGLDEEALRNLNEERTMYQTLADALEDNPNAEVVFVRDFDTLCRRFCDIAKCEHHEEIIELDNAVATELGVEFDRPYRIIDLLEAIQREKVGNPRAYFAISRGSEKIPEWRDSVRRLSLRIIEG